MSPEASTVSEDAPPHIAMLVANDASGDARVLKTADSLGRAGYQVTLIAFSSALVKGNEERENFSIVRVPVAMRMKEKHRVRADRVRAVLRLPFFNVPTDRARQLGDIHQKYRNRRHAVRVADLRRARRDALLRSRNASRGWATRVMARLHSRLLLARLNARRATHLARRLIRRWRTVMYRRPFPADLIERVAEAFKAFVLPARWTALVPEYLDYDLAYGAVIRKLDPDVIHAHDFSMLPTAARASMLGRADGERIPWIYDIHEYIPGVSYAPRSWRRAVLGMEREIIHQADALVTVSDAVADRMVDLHGVEKRPAVVLNAPVRSAPRHPETQSIREVLHLSSDTPLIIYTGTIHPMRGLRTVIAALPSLRDAHFAIVAPRKAMVGGGHLEELQEQARALGVGDRVHVVPYVPADQVIHFIASADLGTQPFDRYGNADVALPNKMFEYIHAGVPVVASDCTAQAEFVSQTEIGEVFLAGDAADFADKAAIVLADRDRYATSTQSEALRARCSWEAQEERLVEIYRDLVGIPEAKSMTAIGLS